jgi:glycosyltransferase involved in cell wall biosynthesis
MLLTSIKRQTVPPDEVVIVYDDTKPSITTLPYLQVQNRNPFLSRREGFLTTTKEVVCFLDADDYISDDYLAAGLSVKTDNNIVYSDMQQFGTSHKLLRYQPKFMSQENFIHIGALVNRDSIHISKVFKSRPLTNCHEDWVFWRKLLKVGCPVTKQSGIYYNRRHDANRSLNIDQLPFHQAKGIYHDTIGFVRTNNQRHDKNILNQWSPKQTETYVIRPKDTTAINNIINTTLADYLLFYDDHTDVVVTKIIEQLQYGTTIIQMKDRKLWSGTFVVVDLLRSQTPFYRPTGPQILI